MPDLSLNQEFPSSVKDIKKVSPEKEIKKEKPKKHEKKEDKKLASEGGGTSDVHVGRLDMRVGLIRTAKKHPDADR